MSFLFGARPYVMVTIAMNKPDTNVVLPTPLKIRGIELISAVLKKSSQPMDQDLMLFCDLVEVGESYLGSEQLGENTNLVGSNLLAILPWFLYEKSPVVEAKYSSDPVPSFKIWLRRLNGEEPVLSENEVSYICLKLEISLT